MNKNPLLKLVSKSARISVACCRLSCYHIRVDVGVGHPIFIWVIPNLDQRENARALNPLIVRDHPI